MNEHYLRGCPFCGSRVVESEIDDEGYCQVCCYGCEASGPKFRCDNHNVACDAENGWNNLVSDRGNIAKPKVSILP